MYIRTLQAKVKEMVQSIDNIRSQLYTIHRHIALTVTKRERQILDQISKGHTTDKIAQTLFISHHTVLSHRKNLMQKMDAPNAASLVRKGFEFGLLKI